MHYGAQRLNGETLKKACMDCLDALKELDVTPAAIVMQGVSGMCVGFPLAVKLGVPYVVIRKPDDTHHHDYTDTVGCLPDNGTLVVVDDFMDSGETVRRIVDAIHKDSRPARVVVLLYGLRRCNGRMQPYNADKSQRAQELKNTKVYFVRRD